MLGLLLVALLLLVCHQSGLGAKEPRLRKDRLRKASVTGTLALAVFEQQGRGGVTRLWLVDAASGCWE